MATLVAKTYVIPTIASVRLTCAGLQYTVETPAYIDTVTVTNQYMTCTCHKVHCEHIRAVERRRAIDAENDARRDTCSILFDL